MNKFVSALIISIIVSVCAVFYTQAKNNDLQRNLVRLHVVANSDSEEDQRVKLMVRDEILKEVDVQDKYFLEKAQVCADRVLRRNGFNYRSEAVSGKFYFPEREYNGIILPNGEYFGVRLLLGEAKGKNWWCILYPPVCSSDKGEELLKEKVNNDTYDIISGEGDKVKVKLKIVELINGIGESLKK